MAQNTGVVGIQWGDEGKGKVVDAQAEEHDCIVRYGGGANAGHTVIVGDEKYALNLVPSGVLHPDKKCVIGNGVLVDPVALLQDIEKLPEEHARIYVSDRAHIVLPRHIEADILTDKKKKIGTTKRGIGPTTSDKVLREGVRFCDKEWPDYFTPEAWENLAKYFEGEKEKIAWEKKKKFFDKTAIEKIREYVCDTRLLLQSALKKGERILFEGAQGALLDVDQGTYPYITSTTATIGGAFTGTGIYTSDIRIIGVAKAYTTRVGGGPFPTELTNEVGAFLQEKGKEFGTTTGRKRRCGWFDAVAARYGAEVNGCHEIALTKLDVLSGLEELLVCTGYYKITIDGEEVSTIPASVKELEHCIPRYATLKGWKKDISNARNPEDLPRNAQEYVAFLEQILGKPITFVGTGSDRKQLLRRQEPNGIMYFT